jgi:hypothetical protein
LVGPVVDRFVDLDHRGAPCRNGAHRAAALANDVVVIRAGNVPCSRAGGPPASPISSHPRREAPWS